MCSNKRNSWAIPFGGNAFVTSVDQTLPPEAVITANGVEKWESNQTRIALYFHCQSPVRLHTDLRLSVSQGASRIKVSLSHYDISKRYFREVQAREIDIEGSVQHLESCGAFDIESPGYARMEIGGVRKAGPTFAEISNVVFTSDENSLSEEIVLRFVADKEDFYFGRRGPSVHLQYPLDDKQNYEYFYNEIYVPKDQDVNGAYFCAIGFTGGYFGMQVNSRTERRILFSIWAEYKSDDPGAIPDDYKVKLVRKGDDVYVGEFGDEGSGAQSYLKHMWQAETTCKFLVQGYPLDAEKTLYTAWFNDGQGWILIASFEKPKVSMFLKSPYSFSENFNPDQGYLQRKSHFGNQWARTSNGEWSEITSSTFTADAISNKQARMDVSGGVAENGTHFFLKNCGFFSDRVVPGSKFNRIRSGSGPPVDVALLP